MIARCPVCSTRHDIPAPLDSSGTLVDCAGCAHRWVEGVPAVAISLRPPEAPALDAPSKPPSPHPLMEAARRSQAEFCRQRRARRVHAAAWGALVALSLAPVAVLLAMPEQVVAAMPASIALYDRLGRQVNIYGLDIRKVDLQHLMVDGHKVIAVKGEVINVSGSERKIPWLRFGLTSNDNAEVYHWMIDTDVRPLKPGESTSFVTRLASPPETARNLEIRFARADEIGSNAQP